MSWQLFGNPGGLESRRLYSILPPTTHPLPISFDTPCWARGSDGGVVVKGALNFLELRWLNTATFLSLRHFWSGSHSCLVETNSFTFRPFSLWVPLDPRSLLQGLKPTKGEPAENFYPHCWQDPGPRYAFYVNSAKRDMIDLLSPCWVFIKQEKDQDFK